MGRIFVCGDTHGTRDFNKLKELSIAKKLTFDDYIIICGDCGIVWSKEFLPQHLRAYKSLYTNILFVDGNHENYDMLNSYPVSEWNGGKVHKISENIYHLMRGQVFNIENKLFFTLGGADSHDKESRIKNVSWWPEERINFDDLAESITNLKKCNKTVDYVISHLPPNSLVNEIKATYKISGEQIPSYIENKLLKFGSYEKIEFIEKNIHFKRWFCGHLHFDFSISKYFCLYENIYQINWFLFLLIKSFKSLTFNTL